MRVYFNEFNVVMGKFRYLPIVSGILKAYAETNEIVSDHYTWAPFLYQMDSVPAILERYHDPVVAAFSVSMWNEQLNLAVAREVKSRWPECLVIFGGYQVPHHPEQYMERHPFIDICVTADGEESFREVLERAACEWGSREPFIQYEFDDIPGITWRFQCRQQIISNPGTRPFNKDLDCYPSPYLTGQFDGLLAERTEEKDWQAIIETNRGCPFPCLSGDTLVDTVYGQLPIKHLADKHNRIGVFTYDRKEKRVKVSTAQGARVTGRGKKLLRVWFDDNTFVDCTPEHRFLKFKWGNQFAKEREWETEAKDLRPGDRVRAIKRGLSGPDGKKYMEVCWSRRGRAKEHRLVAEWMLGRPLRDGEQVHHKDGHKIVNYPENLEVVSSQKEHYQRHPEVAQRMREDNPSKNGLSPEWKEKVRKGITGLKRSVESKERYRQAAKRREASKTVKEKSARAKKGVRTKRRKGIPIGNSHRDKTTGQFTGNHVVVRVEPLPGLHDVYCLEVPETQWFYANGVLVHNCAFCAWGRGGLWSKFRFHSMERVKAEVDWCGKNHIPYVFNADSNFGQHPRDYEIAEHLVTTKKTYGYPDKFRTCFGKNTDEKIFKVATLLHGAGMEKGITLARQSNDETTLKNINRQNISLATYRNLQTRFNDQGIPVYVELILGLPGETVGSWKKGIDDCLINAGGRNSLFIYLCQVLPNTEMADLDYQVKHGVKVCRVELQEIHGSHRSEGWVKEYEDIVTETATMPHAEWREMAKFGWMTMFLHSMKAGFFILSWLWDRFRIPPSEFIQHVLDNSRGRLREEVTRWEGLLDGMVERGEGRGQILPQYGDIYWDVEEAALLRTSEEWSTFYFHLGSLLAEFVMNRDIYPSELGEVVFYQLIRMPQATPPWRSEDLVFSYNIPEYFDKLLTSAPVSIVEKAQKFSTTLKNWSGDQARFARETVLWGRKSGTMLVPCTYEDV